MKKYWATNVPCAPWAIAPEALDSEAVRATVEAIQRGQRSLRDRGPAEDASLSLDLRQAD